MTFEPKDISAKDSIFSSSLSSLASSRKSGGQLGHVILAASSSEAPGTCGATVTHWQ
jgi:hypothetical protein